MPTDRSTFDYADVFDVVDFGIVVLDAQRRIAGWNDWIARVSGFSRNDVLVKNFFDVFPGSLRSRLSAVIDDSFEFGSSSVLTHSLNALLPLKDDRGQQLLHNVIVRPLFGATAKHCLLQISDVTVAVTRERILRERQNARYRAIVDTAPDAIITTSEDGVIQWLNGEAERAFGWTTAELLGKNIDDILNTGTIFSDAFANQPTTGPVSIEVSGHRRQGQLVHFSVSFSHWEADDRTFVTTIWRDVTDLIETRHALLKSNEELEARVVERTQERETALNQLHESQKMESIGQLTGGMAHDFNNLLAVILGNLALLKKSIPQDSRSARLLDGAIQGAERGATLTKRLLAFARRQELTLESVEIQKILPDIIDFLQQSVGRAITISVDIPTDLPAISIDANQFELALMNLVLNARDAMPNGGTIKISCRSETEEATVKRPAELQNGEFVRVVIADTGEGMSATTLARAMEPFFTTKGVGKGTGLGLSMVQGLTAQSGGAMQLTSELGKGTVVTLWFPRAADTTSSEPSPNVASTGAGLALKELKVLLVDDDALVRMGAADMLLDLGHRVVEAGSAKDALYLLDAQGPFDIVITDFAMPGMSGLDLGLKVQQTYPGLPVLLATGYAELPAGGSQGRFPRLSKPFSQEQLAESLAVAVGGPASVTAAKLCDVSSRA